MKVPKSPSKHGMMISRKSEYCRYMTFIKKHGDNIMACVPAWTAQFDEDDDSDRKIDFFVSMAENSGKLGRRDWKFNRGGNNLD